MTYLELRHIGIQVTLQAVRVLVMLRVYVFGSCKELKLENRSLFLSCANNYIHI